MSIKSSEALEYEQDFLKQITRKHQLGLDGQLSLRGHIYYRSGRSDLSDELLCDMLEKSGVIVNDRRIRHKDLRAFIDKDNPRVEISIFVEEAPIVKHKRKAPATKTDQRHIERLTAQR
jgi:Holliday junction resolvase RusA-like endonuclease